MEFLYKLYDTEYFGIGLFIVITILTFLFLIILFFGKKDEKVRKLEETKKLELANANAFKEDETGSTELELPVIEQPTVNPEAQAMFEPVIASTEVSFSNSVKEEPVKVEEANNKDVDIPIINSTAENNIFEPVKEDDLFQPVDGNMNFEFNDNKVAEQPENNFTSKGIELPKMDSFAQLENETKEENAINLDELFQNNDITEPIVEQNIEPMEKPSLKVEAPFSSVYTNDEILKPNVEVKEETTISTSSPFELPKKVEMPKLNTKKPEEKAVEPVSDFDSLFGNIEPEIFNIDK